MFDLSFKASTKLLARKEGSCGNDCMMGWKWTALWSRIREWLL